MGFKLGRCSWGLCIVAFAAVFLSGCMGLGPIDSYGGLSQGELVKSEPLIGAGSIFVRPGGETFAVVFRNTTGDPALDVLGTKIAGVMRSAGYREVSPEEADYVVDAISQNLEFGQLNSDVETGISIIDEYNQYNAPCFISYELSLVIDEKKVFSGEKKPRQKGRVAGDVRHEGALTGKIWFRGSQILPQNAVQVLHDNFAGEIGRIFQR